MNNNLIINGNFDLWQRGTTFSIPYDDPLAASAYTAPNLKVADRWYLIDAQERDAGSTGSVVLYREEFSTNSSFSGFAKYYLTLKNQITDIVSGHSYIENKQENCKSFAGIPLVLSFYAKSLNGVTGITMSAYYRQVFSSSTETAVEFSTVINVEPQWNYYSIDFTPQNRDFSGATGDHYFSVGFKTHPNKNLSIASVFLQERKEDIYVYALTDPQEEKKRQEKYYRTTYPIGFTAGSITVTGGNDLAALTLNVNPNYSNNHKFDVPMRKTPTVTVYSPKSGTQNDAYNKTAGKDMRTTSGTKGWNQTTRFSPTGAQTLTASGNTYGIQFNISSGAVVFDDLLVHYVADADITTGPTDLGLQSNAI